jgi:hypothetical protein
MRLEEHEGIPPNSPANSLKTSLSGHKFRCQQAPQKRTQDTDGENISDIDRSFFSGLKGVFSLLSGKYDGVSHGVDPRRVVAGLPAIGRQPLRLGLDR